MTLKIFQIHQRSQKRLDKWYEYLEKYFGDNPQILKLREIADKENKNDFCIVSKIPHNFFWTGLFLFIIIGGLSLLFVKPVKELETKTPTTNISITLKTDNKTEVIPVKKDTTIIIKK